MGRLYRKSTRLSAVFKRLGASTRGDERRRTTMQLRARYGRYANECTLTHSPQQLLIVRILLLLLLMSLLPRLGITATTLQSGSSRYRATDTRELSGSLCRHNERRIECRRLVSSRFARTLGRSHELRPSERRANRFMGNLSLEAATPIK